MVRRIFANIGKTRRGIPQGSKENIRPKFLAWVLFGFSIHMRKNLLRRIKDAPAGSCVCILRSRADIDRFVEGAGRLADDLLPTKKAGADSGLLVC